jgi:hypothetical protein
MAAAIRREDEPLDEDLVLMVDTPVQETQPNAELIVIEDTFKEGLVSSKEGSASD